MSELIEKLADFFSSDTWIQICKYILVFCLAGLVTYPLAIRDMRHELQSRADEAEDAEAAEEAESENV